MQKNSPARKIPPSRVKYEKEHPTIAVRVSKDLKGVLEDMRQKTGLTYPELIVKGLTQSEQAWVDEIFQMGYEAGVSEYGIWYHCSKCGKKMFITPNGKSHQAIIRYLAEEGWGHSECPT